METIKIGKVQKPFGVKGEVKVFPLTDFVKERFVVGKDVIFTLQNSTRTLTIESIRNHQGSLLIKFKGLNSLNDVEHFHQGVISVDKVERHDLPEDEYYFDELESMHVFLDGKDVGEVVEVMDMPAHPVLRVKTEEKDILIPFNDTFIKSVNKDEKEIELIFMEGLF